MFRHLLKCRGCDWGADNRAPGIKSAQPTEKLSSVFNLGLQPLANSFRAFDEEQTGYAPLEVLQCPRCGLAQLSVIVDPKILYANYPYVTSNSDTMLEHFKTLAEDLAEENGSGAVIEIGSNNGALLKYLSTMGFGNCVGIEPAENLATQANKDGVMTTLGVLSADTAATARICSGEPKHILARHVFCHIDDWETAIRDIASICNKDTLVSIEVPYVVDQMAQVSFDQIYFEHLSYMNVGAMAARLKGSGLHLHRVNRYPIHGGAILMMLRHDSSDLHAHPSVGQILMMEKVTGHEWKQFHKQSCIAATDLKSFVDVAKSQGKRICGFGASAKSTVWLNWCGFRKSQIEFVCDNTPAKQGKLCPGTDIPVVDEGALLRELPDYAILHCWNFKAEAISKNQLYLEKGGKFIIPIPKLEIVSK